LTALSLRDQRVGWLGDGAIELPCGYAGPGCMLLLRFRMSSGEATVFGWRSSWSPRQPHTPIRHPASLSNVNRPPMSHMRHVQFELPRLGDDHSLRLEVQVREVDNPFVCSTEDWRGPYVTHDRYPRPSISGIEHAYCAFNFTASSTSLEIW
jgi:hypothetical protein